MPGVRVQQHHVEVGVHHAAHSLDDAVHVESGLDQLMDLLVVHVERSASDDLEEVRSGELETRQVVLLGEVRQVRPLDVQASDLPEGRPEFCESLDRVFLAEANGLVLVVCELLLDHFPRETDVRVVLGGDFVEQLLFLLDEEVHHILFDHVPSRLSVHDDFRGQLDDELVVFFDPCREPGLPLLQRVDFLQLHAGDFAHPVLCPLQHQDFSGVLPLFDREVADLDLQVLVFEV